MDNTRTYFITICTQNRAKILCDIDSAGDGPHVHLNSFGKCVETVLLQIPDRYPGVTINSYVIMPNHVHIIFVFGTIVVGAIHESHDIDLDRAGRDPHLQQDRSLPKIIGYLKMNSAKQINIIRESPGVPVWQKRYYDHVVRNQESLKRIQEYIRNNPFDWNENEDDHHNYD